MLLEDPQLLIVFCVHLTPQLVLHPTLHLMHLPVQVELSALLVLAQFLQVLLDVVQLLLGLFPVVRVLAVELVEFINQQRNRALQSIHLALQGMVFLFFNFQGLG